MAEVSLRGMTVTVEQKLVTETCCNCGMLFAMTEEYVRRRRNAPGSKFHCPDGHPQHYTGKSEAAKLREQLEEERRLRERAQQNIAMWQDDARSAREEAEHQRHRANGYKGHATKITKRAKAGVCPCCNRTFAQLARHMATQHPTFTPEVPDPPRLSAAA